MKLTSTILGSVMALGLSYWFFFTYSPKNAVCVQVLQKARNPITGEERIFSTPCSVPIGWKKLIPDQDIKETSNHLIFDGVTYSILQKIKKGGKEIFLTTTSLDENSCYGYVGTSCALFLRQGEETKYIKQIGDVNKKSTFKWFGGSDSEIIYKPSFGEGGWFYEAIHAVNITNGSERELIIKTRGVNAEPFSTPARTMIQQENCGVAPEYTGVKRNNHTLEFLDCYRQDSKHFYLILNGELVKSYIFSKDQTISLKNLFELDLEENMLDDKKFRFDFINKKYDADLETNQLREL